MYRKSASLSALVLLIVGGSCSSPKVQSSQAVLASKLNQGLGTVSFGLAASKSTTIAYDPSIKLATSLSAVDNSGYTWTLTIPSNDISSSVDITLTPASLISGPPGVSPVSAVEINPAGLIFNLPATLYSTAPLGKPSLVDYYETQSQTDGLQFGAMTRSGTDLVTSGGVIVGVTRTQASSRVTDYLQQLIQRISADRRGSPISMITLPQANFACTASKSIGSATGKVLVYEAQFETLQRQEVDDLDGAIDTALLTGALTDSSSQISESFRLINVTIGEMVARISSAVRSQWSDSRSFDALSASAASVSGLANSQTMPASGQSNISNATESSVRAMNALVSRWKSSIEHSACNS